MNKTEPHSSGEPEKIINADEQDVAVNKSTAKEVGFDEPRRYDEGSDDPKNIGKDVKDQVEALSENPSEENDDDPK
jgi:hypothetical protein